MTKIGREYTLYEDFVVNYDESMDNVQLCVIADGAPAHLRTIDSFEVVQHDAQGSTGEEIEYNFYAFVHTSSIFVTNGLSLHRFALDLIRSEPHTVQNFSPEEYGRLVENARG